MTQAHPLDRKAGAIPDTRRSWLFACRDCVRAFR